MTVQVLGRTFHRQTVEALIEAMIAALDDCDGDAEGESEFDEDDQRALPKELPEGW